MNSHHTGHAPVYAANSGGRPRADKEGTVADGWEVDGEMVRSAYVLHAEDDDFTQPSILEREPVLSRAFQLWKTIDANVGQRIEDKVKAGVAPQPAKSIGEAS